MHDTGVRNQASKCVWHDCHDKFTASRRFAAIPEVNSAWVFSFLL